jgi:biotin transport system substrate-specific component
MSSGAPLNTLPSATLVATLWPASPSRRRSARRPAVDWTRGVLLVVLGSFLLTVASKVQVPLYPVPMTLQTLAVLVIGAAYGWRLAGATLLAYVAQGAAGLPVFAGPVAGPAVLMGPTGGFILGFVAAAVFVGWFAERGWDRPLLRLAVLMTVGHLIVFAAGLAWLAHAVGPARAWTLGAEPFLLATLLKTGLAVAAMQAGWTLIRR